MIVVNKLKSLLKTIIICLTPKKKRDYYKHLANYDKEIVYFPMEEGNELVVPKKEFEELFMKGEK